MTALLSVTDAAPPSAALCTVTGTVIVAGEVVAGAIAALARAAEARVAARTAAGPAAARWNGRQHDAGRQSILHGVAADGRRLPGVADRDAIERIVAGSERTHRELGDDHIGRVADLAEQVAGARHARRQDDARDRRRQRCYRRRGAAGTASGRDAVDRTRRLSRLGQRVGAGAQRREGVRAGGIGDR